MQQRVRCDHTYKLHNTNGTHYGSFVLVLFFKEGVARVLLADVVVFFYKCDDP